MIQKREIERGKTPTCTVLLGGSHCSLRSLRLALAFRFSSFSARRAALAALRIERSSLSRLLPLRGSFRRTGGATAPGTSVTTPPAGTATTSPATFLPSYDTKAPRASCAARRASLAAPAGRQRRPSHAAKMPTAPAAGAACASPAADRAAFAREELAPRPRPPPPPPPGSPSLSSLSSDDEAASAALAPPVRCSALANPSAHHSVPAYKRSRLGGAFPRPVPSVRVVTASGSAMPSRRVPRPVPGVQPSCVRRRAPRPETGGGGGGGGGDDEGDPSCRSEQRGINGSRSVAR